MPSHNCLNKGRLDIDSSIVVTHGHNRFAGRSQETFLFSQNESGDPIDVLNDSCDKSNNVHCGDKDPRHNSHLIQHGEIQFPTAITSNNPKAFSVLNP